MIIHRLPLNEQKVPVRGLYTAENPDSFAPRRGGYQRQCSIKCPFPLDFPSGSDVYCGVFDEQSNPQKGSHRKKVAFKRR